MNIAYYETWRFRTLKNLKIFLVRKSCQTMESRIPDIHHKLGTKMRDSMLLYLTRTNHVLHDDIRTIKESLNSADMAFGYSGHD